VFDDLRQGIKKIEFLANPGAGEVWIGCTSFVAENFVSAVIKRLSRRYPGIVFHLVTADEVGTLYRELSERNVDLVTARRVAPLTDEEFGFEIFYDSSFAVVTGARSPWVRRRPIALADLVKESWLLPPPGGATGPTYLEVFRASGLDYPPTTVFAAPQGFGSISWRPGVFLRLFRSQH
jgi:DNA-binding transcriptional LysR family regulator